MFSTRPTPSGMLKWRRGEFDKAKTRDICTPLEAVWTGLAWRFTKRDGAGWKLVSELRQWK